ncbi:MAG TPA: dipeptide ABC transporter ATP-binding protein [Pirellulales bacterium]
MPEPLLKVEHLKKYFPVRKGLFQRVAGHVKAVDDVSFHIDAGETLGLVGESGCGKTTVGRTLLRLIEPTGGSVTFDGKDVRAAQGAELRRLRRDLQIVFQDPFGSLNPRMTVRSIIEEGLVIHRVGNREERRARVAELLGQTGLDPSYMDRYPHEFSGGQRQRICIARALALNPRFIVLDEPISALDVSIQSQVVNLLNDLKDKYNLTYLFISHDLSVVEYISNRVAVMYLGQIVEMGTSSQLYREPLHPYSKVLLSSAPSMDPNKKRGRVVVQGDVPSPVNPPSGCRFHPRCPIAMDVCKHVAPPVVTLDGRFVTCHAVAQEVGQTAAAAQAVG